MNLIKTKIRFIKCGESCKITNDLIKKLDQNIYTNYDYFLSGHRDIKKFSSGALLDL